MTISPSCGADFAWKAREHPGNLFSGCHRIFPILVLTSGQAWGVIQEYYQEHLFPDASDSLLSALGSMSGMVRSFHITLEATIDRNPSGHDPV